MNKSRQVITMRVWERERERERESCGGGLALTQLTYTSGVNVWICLSGTTAGLKVYRELNFPSSLDRGGRDWRLTEPLSTSITRLISCQPKLSSLFLSLRLSLSIFLFLRRPLSRGKVNDFFYYSLLFCFFQRRKLDFTTCVYVKFPMIFSFHLLSQ